MKLKVSIVVNSVRAPRGLAVLLDGTPAFSCTSVHATLKDALREIPKIKPDLALVDLQLPGRQGLECIRKLRDIMPELPLVVLSHFDDPDLVFDAIKAGADAYLLKRAPPAELLEAIELVHRGGSIVTPCVAHKLFNYIRGHSPATGSVEKLSAREEEVLRAARIGLSYKKIAADLGVSYDSVRTHFRNIYQKLHVHSKGEAVAKYFKL